MFCVIPLSCVIHPSVRILLSLSILLVYIAAPRYRALYPVSVYFYVLIIASTFEFILWGTSYLYLFYSKV